MDKFILLTWRNMMCDPEVTAEIRQAHTGENEEKEATHTDPVVAPSKPLKPMAAFVPRMQKNHADKNFEIVYFDGGPYPHGATLDDHLKSKIPNDLDHYLKIYISGHGGIGKDFITDDKQTQFKTVNELARLLAYVLADRATDVTRSRDTKINMLSCLFARTPDGAANSSPAAKLHDLLRSKHIFVDLVGRTESISALPEGLSTINLLDSKTKGKRLAYYQAKMPHTRILHSVDASGEQRIGRLEFDKQAYTGSETPAGRRLLWADHAVQRIVAALKTDALGNIADGRQRTLADIVEFYNGTLDVARFRDKLQALVQSNNRFDVDKNFMLHRGGTMSKMFGPVFNIKPASAVFVESLLRDFPTR